MREVIQFYTYRKTKIKVKEQCFYFCSTAVLSLLPSINATSGHLCCFDVIWFIEFHFSDAGLSTRKQNTGEIIIQIP